MWTCGVHEAAGRDQPPVRSGTHVAQRGGRQREQADTFHGTATVVWDHSDRAMMGWVEMGWAGMSEGGFSGNLGGGSAFHTAALQQHRVHLLKRAEDGGAVLRFGQHYLPTARPGTQVRRPFRRPCSRSSWPGQPVKDEQHNLRLLESVGQAREDLQGSAHGQVPTGREADTWSAGQGCPPLGHICNTGCAPGPAWGGPL